MNKIEMQHESFEKRALEYYEQRKNNNSDYYKELLWNLFFQSNLEIKEKTILVLDAMCGYGDGYKILKNNLNVEIKYNGFDFSEIMINIAKKNYPEINFEVMNVLDFNEKNKYDLVILIGGLHHVPDYTDIILKKIYLSLRKGGYFINFEPSYGSLFIKKVRQFVYKKNDTFDEETEIAYNIKDLTFFYIKQGFKIVDQLHPGLLAYILYYSTNAFPKLNIGGKGLVKTLFNIDKLFFRNVIGRKLSFSIITLCQKQ